LKIALCNVGSHRKFALKKDIMGGFGEGAFFGNSFRAKILHSLKMTGIVYPPISFGYIASIMAKKGWGVEVLTNRIPQDADVILVHSSTTEHDTEIEFCKKTRAQTDSRVGAIGPMATFVPQPYLDVVDFVVSGEPESFFAAWPQGDYMPEGVVSQPTEQELYETNFPAWEYFDFKRFSYFPNIPRKPIVPVLASRGCSKKCSYCPYLAYFGNWKSRSLDSVINELRHHKDRLGIRGCLFRDPLFTKDLKRVAILCDRIISEDFDIHWSCETRWDHLSLEIIDKMYDAGCRNINMGIESRQQLPEKQRMDFQVTLERAKEVFKYCYSKGIFVGVFFTIGFPEDTKQEIDDLIDYARILPVDAAQFFSTTTTFAPCSSANSRAHTRPVIPPPRITTLPAIWSPFSRQSAEKRKL